MKVECIKDLLLSDGVSEFKIEYGTEWEVKELSINKAFIENEIHWAEISIEDYENNFKELKYW